MFRRWMTKDPVLFWTVCVVVLVHGLGLGFLAWRLPTLPLHHEKEKKLVVKTIKLTPPKKPVNEEKIIAKASQPSVMEPATIPQPSVPPPPKSNPSKPSEKKQQKAQPPPKKMEIEKPKTSPKQAKPKENSKQLEEKKENSKPSPNEVKSKENSKQVEEKKRKLLRQAQEALAKIDSRTENVKSGSTQKAKVPKRIESLSFVGVKSAEKGESSSQSSYRMELAAHLRAQLQLPEMGNVEIKLVITKEGRIEKVVVVKSENERNAEYISKSLPTLSLPPFGDTFRGEGSHAFHITLTNE